ncbi:unnamed protein product, partial [Prorocentrum cordatum]
VALLASGALRAAVGARPAATWRSLGRARAAGGGGGGGTPAGARKLVAPAGAPSAGRPHLRLCEALALAARRSPRAAGEWQCPLVEEVKPETVPYFQKLHAAIVDGSGDLEGCRNNSAQEHYVQEFDEAFAQQRWIMRAWIWTR